MSDRIIKTGIRNVEILYVNCYLQAEAFSANNFIKSASRITLAWRWVWLQMFVFAEEMNWELWL